MDAQALVVDLAVKRDGRAVECSRLTVGHVLLGWSPAVVGGSDPLHVRSVGVLGRRIRQRVNAQRGLGVACPDRVHCGGVGGLGLDVVGAIGGSRCPYIPFGDKRCTRRHRSSRAGCGRRGGPAFRQVKGYLGAADGRRLVGDQRGGEFIVSSLLNDVSGLCNRELGAGRGGLGLAQVANQQVVQG